MTYLVAETTILPYQLKTRFDGRCVHAHLSGTLTLTTGRTIVEEVRALCQKHACSRVLADIREADVELSVLDRFQLGVHVAGQVLITGMAFKIACVILPGMVLPDKFFETVTSNRGVLLTTFTEPDTAMRWLEERIAG